LPLQSIHPQPELGARERQVFALFERAAYITRKDVEHAVGVSQATAITLLHNMLKKGLIAKEGNGKNLRYRRGT